MAKLLYCKRDILKEINAANVQTHNYNDNLDQL